jgi:hypothetical protein
MTNWTLETLLTNSDIHFFSKIGQTEEIPNEVLQRYETFKDFFLLNNELTFNTTSNDIEHIPHIEDVFCFDERKNIWRKRFALNS